MPCQRNTVWQRGLRGSCLGVMTGVSAVAVCALKHFGMRARRVHSFCVIIAVILASLQRLEQFQGHYYVDGRPSGLPPLIYVNNIQHFSQIYIKHSLKKEQSDVFVTLETTLSGR